MTRVSLSGTFALCLGSLAACSDDGGGRGSVRINLRAEDSITGGLSPGSGVEDTKDYGVSYAKYIVAVGHLHLARSRGGSERESDAIALVDLMRVGEEGVEIARFEDLPAGQWDTFEFETPEANADADALEVDADDAAEMREHGWTYWIEGTVHRPEAEGGPVDFTIQAAVPTRFEHCQLDGQPGMAVVADQTATGDITIHGDHIWFNTFPTGSEGSVERRAAWLVAADTDEDGQVSTEDLAQLDATEVFTTELGYSLDGQPDGITIDSALDWVRAQLATQGHFRGEGECVWQYGEGHGEHDHAH